MRYLQKMEQEARSLFEGSRKNDRYDLSIGETRELVLKFNEDAQQIGTAEALFELIYRVYCIGMSSGMRFYKNRKGRISATVARYQNEPTEEKRPRSAAATRKEASPVTVGTLERLEDEIYNAYGVDHKPAGLTWVKMALNLAGRITEEPDLLDAITEADLDQLTEENFHTARHAAEVAQYLKKYII